MTRTYRKRVKGSKGERWTKGNSSSSNPSKTRYRDAASSRFFNSTYPNKEVEYEKSKLTAESLLKHDAVFGTCENAEHFEEGSDTENITLDQTAKTFETFATDWTQCTNVSFNKLLLNFKNNNAQQKEMLAVLAAVTEVIKEQGGDTSDIAESQQARSSIQYFAALLSTLEACDDALESVGAVVKLLAMIMRSVPISILQSKFKAVADTLSQRLSKISAKCEDSCQSTVRSLLGCISLLLRAQTISAWSLSPTMDLFVCLLSFVTHTRPKIRKAGQYVVSSIIKDLSLFENQKHHPAASRTATHLLETIENNGNSPTTILYCLALLVEVLPFFPLSSTKITMELLLRLMTNGSKMIVAWCLRAFHNLFVSRPVLDTLSTQLNAQIIAAFYDFKPSINDPQPISAWLMVMQEAHINLSLNDPLLCLGHLPRLFGCAVHCWLSDSPTVSKAVTNCLKTVSNECIYVRNELEEAPNYSDLLKKMFIQIEEGFKYQYHTVWCQVVSVVLCFVEAAGQHCSTFIGPCLRTLAELRASASNNSLRKHIDYFVGSVIRVLGPSLVLSHVPLDITGRETSYDFPHSWLLPVLRSNIRHARLGYFKEYFLPLAYVCDARANKCQRENDKIGYKTFELITCQIWGLLPGFCNRPVDMAGEFNGKFAKTLGTHLRDDKRLRMDIMAALRQLIIFALNTSETCHNVLSSYAKNFLPILFNLYTMPQKCIDIGVANAIYETIKLYVQISDSELLSSIYDMAFDKLGEAETSLKGPLMELLLILTPLQDVGRVENMFSCCTNLITDLAEDKKFRLQLQKKAYRIMEQICMAESESTRQFIDSRMDLVQKFLLEVLPGTSANSQCFRLRCLLSIIGHMKVANTEFVYATVPEAIVCIKSANERARKSAFLLLISIGKALIRWAGNTDYSNVMNEYLKVILAGLSGVSTTLIQCTILAVTRVYFEFHQDFSPSLCQMLVNNACVLLGCKSREVVGSAVSFLRVFVSTYPVYELGTYLTTIVRALSAMPEDCKRYFRLKTRYLWDRLIRKFGYEMIVGLLPINDLVSRKRLSNIRKIQARKKKNILLQEEQVTEDNEDENFNLGSNSCFDTIDDILTHSDDETFNDNQMVGKNKKKRAGKKNTFISEDAEDGAVLDLLDPLARAKRVTMKPPSQLENSSKMGSNGGFKMGSDGKLLITENLCEDDEVQANMRLAKSKAERDFMMLNDSDDNEKAGVGLNSFANMVSTSSARKRKIGSSIATEGNSRHSFCQETKFMKYQSGGKGIHRNLSSSKKSHSSVVSKNDGSLYRSKKAFGDVKRMGKPDPFAYIPLRKSSLNKRNMAKRNHFKNIFKGVKLGTKRSSNFKNRSSKVKRIKTMMHRLKVN